MYKYDIQGLRNQLYFQINIAIDIINFPIVSLSLGILHNMYLVHFPVSYYPSFHSPLSRVSSKIPHPSPKNILDSLNSLRHCGIDGANYAAIDGLCEPPLMLLLSQLTQGSQGVLNGSTLSKPFRFIFCKS